MEDGGRPESERDLVPGRPGDHGQQTGSPRGQCSVLTSGSVGRDHSLNFTVAEVDPNQLT